MVSAYQMMQRMLLKDPDVWENISYIEESGGFEEALAVAAQILQDAEQVSTHVVIEAMEAFADKMQDATDEIWNDQYHPFLFPRVPDADEVPDSPVNFLPLNFSGSPPEESLSPLDWLARLKAVLSVITPDRVPHIVEEVTDSWEREWEEEDEEDDEE